MPNPIVKKKPTPTQKAYSTPKSSPLGKESLKKPSLLGKSSAYSGLSKAGASKRKRFLDDEAEEEEEDWEEVDEPEQDDASEEEEDAYAQLESEEELLQVTQKPQQKKTLASTSKPPPKKKKAGEKSASWFDFAKKAVERIPLFSELQL